MKDVYADADALAHAAAQRVSAAIIAAIDAHGRCAIALSGGSTPARMYELLASEPLRASMRWERVHVYWGDERCVYPGDERSNENMARRTLIDRVPLDARHVHPIRCADDANAAAHDYEQLLRRDLDATRSPLDIMLLGIGDDGHTAGLFPGSPALDERERWTAVVRKDGENFDRITTTFPFLATAHRTFVVVSGASKARAVAAIEQGADLPAARIGPTAQWLLDAAAAEYLVRSE